MEQNKLTKINTRLMYFQNEIEKKLHLLLKDYELSNKEYFVERSNFITSLICTHVFCCISTEQENSLEIFHEFIDAISTSAIEAITHFYLKVRKENDKKKSNEC